jgi:hypothetical protein
MTGVIPVVDDMCTNSCLAFTGPLSHLAECPTCGEARYDVQTKSPRKRFHTIQIGPQLQALWRTENGTRSIQHRSWRTTDILAQTQREDGILSEYNGIYCGRDYLDVVNRGDITSDDMVLLLSIDGAQLFQIRTCPNSLTANSIILLSV